MKNFHGFKKVASDKQSTTFAHENGSKLVVAHAKLDPQTLKKISALPTHGAQKMAEGGIPDLSQIDPNGPAPEIPAQLTGGAQASTSDSPIADTFSDAGKWLMSPAGQAEASNTSPQASPMPQMAPPSQTSSNQSPNLDQAESMDPSSQWMRNVGAGVANEMAGAREMGNAQAGQAKEEAQVFSDQADRAEVARNLYKAHFASLEDERQAFQHDLQNDHINPKHYQESMDSGQKVSTAIGLLLGGMSGGLLRTGVNPAADFLNKQIDRDIESQRENLGIKKTLLESNIKHFGNMEQAAQMTRVMMNDIYAARVNQAAQNWAGPEAQARAKMVSGQLQNQNAMILGNLAASRAQADMAKQGVSAPRPNMDAQVQRQIQMFRMMGAKDRAEDLESRYMPGVGLAAVKVPEKIRDELISRQDLQNKVEDLKSFAKSNSGSLNPATMREGETKAKLVQDAYRRANGQGVFREAEAGFVNGIVGADPTQFFNKYRNQKGYQELGRDNLASLNSLRQGYGLPQQQAPAETAMRGGIQYVKVPGGWKKAK